MGSDNSSLNLRNTRVYVKTCLVFCCVCFLLIDWIKSISGDVYKAQCMWCDVVLPAHLRQLKEHAQTELHIRNQCREVTDAAGELCFPKSIIG